MKYKKKNNRPRKFTVTWSDIKWSNIGVIGSQKVRREGKIYRGRMTGLNIIQTYENYDNKYQKNKQFQKW